MVSRKGVRTEPAEAEEAGTEAAKQHLIRGVAEALSGVVEQEARHDVERREAFIAHYLAHVEAGDLADRTVAQLSGIVASHYRLANRRQPGTDAVELFTPSQATTGWDLDGSTVLQVVTDDRAFVVDSLGMEINRQGWSVREVYHPQYQVIRDADGVIVDVVSRTDPDPRKKSESWVHLEIYPPLGESADERADALIAGVTGVLGDTRVVTDDWPAMKARLVRTIQTLLLPLPDGRREERERACDLLSWLAADHFTFLGYREYSYDGGSYHPIADTGLGLLREGESADAFQALPEGEPPAVIVFTKDSRRSTVHRPGYLDYIGVRLFDPDGRIVGEQRFIGMLSSTAYSESVSRIPVLAAKAAEILDRSHYDASSHGAKQILAVLNSYPRDELFRASVDELAPIVERISHLVERRQVRLFCHRDPWGRFVTCLVFLPRDRYTTTVRERIQKILLDRLGGVGITYEVMIGQSMLARVSFVVRTTSVPEIDVPAIEQELTTATRSWDDSFVDLVAEWPSERRGVTFSDAYTEEFPPEQGVADLEVANTLGGAHDLAFVLDAAKPGDAAQMRLKVFSKSRLALHDVMPHLARLGVDVVDEWPFELLLRGDLVMLYEFGLRLPDGRSLAWTDADRARFVDAFEQSYRGRLELGPMNALVTAAGLTWVEVTWLRAMLRYLRQTSMPYSMEYATQALIANTNLVTLLVSAFRAAHDPADPGDAAAHRARADELLDQVIAGLDSVPSLDHDRIIRALVSLQRAIVRTNAFADRAPDEALAYKLLPRHLDMLPEPKPEFEIWVYSPSVEGVHLRFGKVARGGLRWSDRAEDFRTEVLGLVKAQMVKNTVIVPVGAKGGFLPRRLPDPAVDRAAWLAEGVASYKRFVTALLSVTDNLVDGAVVAPAGVLRHDDDDPYLVVAADKGTATFSDIANEISLAKGFWLGDAFASGGSDGYDHKAMGITARGAWESVKRHFREMGIDCQEQDFTCVGIGDMSGDVFGNGMLLSRHTKLVAAFDHRHVFVDPDPDPEQSFAERERLFGLPRSSWADYDASLLSAGGGVYPRTAKAIPVTAEAREALGIADGVATLTPTEYIRCILAAPVDLLWNGGIGTYVKASTESHADAGDRTNDAVRLDATMVRARCAGEGGNLGWTQLGRIEYARGGGRINTDFIDNSAGVDTSDHEVNIKILLQAQIQAGRLTREERNDLLPEMTDDVAALVLAHNVDQNLALANACTQAPHFGAVHEDWMRALEADGYLDRAIEFLPSSREMRARIAKGEGLSAPELATLLSWTKIRLADIVLASDLPDDPYLADRLVQYFPPLLRERYRDRMPEHRLHREIVTTVAVNRFVNSQGISAYHRLSSDTGAKAADVIRAQLAARAILRVGVVEVRAAKAGLAADVATKIRVELRHLVERVTRWLLHEVPAMDVVATIDRFTEPTSDLLAVLPDVLTEAGRARYDARLGELSAAGVPADVAAVVAGADVAFLVPGIVSIAEETGHDLTETARVFFGLREQLELDRLFDQAERLKTDDRWALMAQSAVRDEVLAVQRELVRQALTRTDDETRPDATADLAMLSDLAKGEPDLARLSVALRVLRTLVRS